MHRQDEANPVQWLATQAVKMDWSYLAHSGLPVTCNKSFINQACLVKIAGYWPHPFFFFASLWTEPKAKSINMQKKELVQYPTILTSPLANNSCIHYPPSATDHFFHIIRFLSVFSFLCIFQMFLKSWKNMSTRCHSEADSDSKITYWHSYQLFTINWSTKLSLGKKIAPCL